MLAVGTMAASEEKAVTARLVAGVSASLTVKVMGPRTASSLMVRSEMAWTTGAALALVTSVTVLLARFGSPVVAPTWARLVRRAETVGRTVMATLTAAPTFMVPMVQRLFALGGQRLLPPALATVGEWKPADPEETWTAIETDRRRDWRWHAGVYQSGAHKVALNRPASEDQLDTVERERLDEMFRGVKLTVMADALALKAEQ